MKRHVKSLLICVAVVAVTQTDSTARENKQIQELELDEHTVYTIPVSFSRVTTVSFPGPISAIDGALITLDGKTSGLFQLAHKQGSYFFSVRSLVKDAATNINVRWNNKTYVVELQDSQAPLLSIIFKYAADGKSSLTRRAVTPGTLVGLLDKAKAYRVLKNDHPEAVEQVDYASYEAQPRVIDYNDFEIRLEEAFRFDPQDTLVFRLVLHNKTDKEIAYKPEGFSLRVGERLYFQSISDASGVMPPSSETPAYFAVTGTPNGGRNDISIKNEFTVLLTRAGEQTSSDHEKPSPAPSLPLDIPEGSDK
jgi:hypothetical protein